MITCARTLKLTTNEGVDDNDFGVELADELPTSLETLTLTEERLSGGNTLRDMNLAPGSLVMMIKRNDRYIVPNGQLQLKPNDVLLIIKEDKM